MNYSLGVETLRRKNIPETYEVSKKRASFQVPFEAKENFKVTLSNGRLLTSRRKP